MLQEELHKERERLERQLAALNNLIAVYEEPAGDQSINGNSAPMATVRASHISPEGDARRRAGYMKYLEEKRKGLNGASNGKAKSSVQPTTLPGNPNRLQPGFWEEAIREALKALGHVESQKVAWDWIKKRFNLPEEKFKAFNNAWWRGTKSGLIAS